MISEKEQRRGAATLPQDSIEDYSDVHALRERVKQQDSEVLAGNYESGRSNVGNSYGQDRARK